MPTDVPLDPQSLLNAYAQGFFPMADRRGNVQWFTADPRGIIPLETFHVPGTLRNLVRKPPELGGFEIRFDYDFESVMRACQEDRDEGTWINEPLIAAYVRLQRMGFAHSVETWKDNKLAGGLYGVSLGAAFFGESMFHRVRDASKVALVHLVKRLKEQKYLLLDTQATTAHLRRFGCLDIPAPIYLEKLRAALRHTASFYKDDE